MALNGYSGWVYFRWDFEVGGCLECLKNSKKVSLVGGEWMRRRGGWERFRGDGGGV